MKKTFTILALTTFCPRLGSDQRAAYSPNKKIKTIISYNAVDQRPDGGTLMV
jgi:hypothetical protein